jgi:hypothetical protein
MLLTPRSPPPLIADVTSPMPSPVASRLASKAVCEASRFGNRFCSNNTDAIRWDGIFGLKSKYHPLYIQMGTLVGGIFGVAPSWANPDPAAALVATAAAAAAAAAVIAPTAAAAAAAAAAASRHSMLRGANPDPMFDGSTFRSSTQPAPVSASDRPSAVVGPCSHSLIRALLLVRNCALHPDSQPWARRAVHAVPGHYRAHFREASRVFAVLCRAIQSPSRTVPSGSTFPSIPFLVDDRSSTSGWWASPPFPGRRHAAVSSSHTAARPRSAPVQPPIRSPWCPSHLKSSTSTWTGYGTVYSFTSYCTLPRTIGKFPSLTFFERRLTVKSEVPRIQRSTGTHAKKGMGNSRRASSCPSM